MALEKIVDKVVETDVLVVGGGIGGCPAAAKAAEHGLNITLVEKAKTDRSGSAGVGIDHFGGAFPRGMTPQGFVEIWENLGWDRAFYGGGPWSDPTRLYRQYANASWAMKELEKLGVTMKWDDGELRTMKGFGREPFRQPFTRVHWMNVKPEMAAGVRRRGVNVLERTMVVDLLTNNGVVVGSTAVNTRTGEFIVIKAKAIVITTGIFTRCFSPETPDPWKYKFRYHWCPASVSGDGWAIAYRAGAELANMEQTWGADLIRDDLVISFGNIPLNEGIPTKVFTWDGEEFTFDDTWSTPKHAKLDEKGKTPLYYSLEHLPDDFHKRMEVAYVDERLVSFKIAQDRGFNPRTHWFEAMPNRPVQFMVAPGINADGDFKTLLKGLYAVGDCVAGCHDVANATTSGFLVGDSIHTFVNKAGEPVVDEAQVESQKQTALAPLAAKDGTEPMELECAIRYICDRYGGVLKSEGKLLEGLRRLGTLRRIFLPKLMAKNPHYLMRCLECRNIMDLAEVHMQACLERKETRGNFLRFDYPERNPSLDDLLIYQRIEDGKAVFEMRKVTPLNMELREER